MARVTDSSKSGMEPQEVDAALRSIGKDRHWLAERTGYTYFTLRDCLAPKGKGISARMEVAIRKALESSAPELGLPLEDFTLEERKAIESLAEQEGFADAQQWMIAKIRAFLVMLKATRKDLR